MRGQEGRELRSGRREGSCGDGGMRAKNDVGEESGAAKTRHLKNQKPIEGNATHAAVCGI